MHATCFPSEAVETGTEAAPPVAEPVVAALGVPERLKNEEFNVKASGQCEGVRSQYKGMTSQCESVRTQRVNGEAYFISRCTSNTYVHYTECELYIQGPVV